MTEQETIIEELRLTLQQAVKVMKRSRTVIDEVLNDYESLEFDADAWDAAAMETIEDLDELLLKLE